MQIYLAGSVPKGKDEEKDFYNWRLDFQEKLGKIWDAEFVDPFDRNLDESDFQAVFGLDCRHIKNSDLVVVNSQDQMGVGTSQELLIAKYFQKPVIVVLPKGTKHRRVNIEFNGQFVEDWIHPFVFATSDFIVETVEEIEKIKDEVFSKPAKNIEIIDEAVEYLR